MLGSLAAGGGSTGGASYCNNALTQYAAGHQSTCPGLITMSSLPTLPTCPKVSGEDATTAYSAATPCTTMVSN